MKLSILCKHANPWSKTVPVRSVCSRHGELAALSGPLLECHEQRYDSVNDQSCPGPRVAFQEGFFRLDTSDV